MQEESDIPGTSVPSEQSFSTTRHNAKGLASYLTMFDIFLPIILIYSVILCTYMYTIIMIIMIMVIIVILQFSLSHRPTYIEPTNFPTSATVPDKPLYIILYVHGIINSK